MTSDIVINRRLGDAISIDGSDAYADFNADLASFSYSPGSVKSDSSRKIGKSGFSQYGIDFRPGSISLVFYIVGDSKSDILKKASDLIVACGKCMIETDVDLTSQYDCVMSSYSVSLTGIEWVAQLSVTLDAIRHLPLVVKKATSKSSLHIYNPGSVQSGICIKATHHLSSKTDLAFSVNNEQFVIKNVTQNEPVVIDGINGKVTHLGSNKILDSTLASFPIAGIGEMTVKCSIPVDFEVSFYPTFVS